MRVLQCRTRFQPCISSPLFWLLSSLALVVTAEQSAEEDVSNPSVFRWLQEEHGENFYFNPKLRLEGDSINVEESLDESEILMVIPSSAIISVNKPEDEMMAVEDLFCALAERFWDELMDGDESDYEPYIQYIHQKHATEPIIPNFWSTIGKRLIGLVYGDYLTTDFLIDWIDDFESCRDFLALPNDNDFDSVVFDNNFENDYTTMWHSDHEQLRRHVLAITAQKQVDQNLFVPLYDQLEHHLLDHNVKHVIKDDYAVVMAQQQISVGETLYRPSQACLFECTEPTQPTVLDIVRNFGHLPNYPHYWEIPRLELAFTIHVDKEATDDKASKPTLSWVEKPNDEQQIESLEFEYERLHAKYVDEVLKSVGTVPEHEWNVIEAYSSALKTALELAIEVGRDEILPATAAEGPPQQEEQEDTSEVECVVEDKADDPVDVHTQDGEDEDDEETQWDPWSITHTTCSKCSLEELEESRGCTDYTYSTIHNQTTWTHLRAAYVAIMGDNATIDATYGSGIRVPFKIDHSPDRGRGVFAMDDVAKGTLVWTGQHTAAFTTGDQFKLYLSVLPDILVCDLTNWCYTSNGESDAAGLIECDLDEGSLINAYEAEEEQTLGCNEDLVDDADLCLENLYAVRDIRGGEEFLTDYNSFSTKSWQDFGL